MLNLTNQQGEVVFKVFTLKMGMKIALNPNINGDLVEVIRQRNRKNLDLTRVSEDKWYYLFLYVHDINKSKK